MSCNSLTNSPIYLLIHPFVFYIFFKSMIHAKFCMMSLQFSHILSKVMYNVKYVFFLHSWRWKAGETVSVRADRLNQKLILIIPWTLAGAERVYLVGQSKISWMRPIESKDKLKLNDHDFPVVMLHAQNRVIW